MFDNPELFKRYGQEFDAEEIVFCEYEKGDKLYYILEGKVRISKITREAEKIIVYLGSGEFLGEMAIFENKPRTATVITEEESRMLVFKKAEFFQLMKVAPNLVVELIKVLSKRYLKTEKQLNSLLEDNTEKKIIKYIYEEYTKQKTKGQVKRLTIKVEEIIAIMDIKREKLLENLISHQKKGHLNMTSDHIVLTEFGWLEFWFK